MLYISFAFAKAKQLEDCDQRLLSSFRIVEFESIFKLRFCSAERTYSADRGSATLGAATPIISDDMMIDQECRKEKLLVAMARSLRP